MFTENDVFAEDNHEETCIDSDRNKWYVYLNKWLILYMVSMHVFLGILLEILRGIEIYLGMIHTTLILSV